MVLFSTLTIMITGETYDAVEASNESNQGDIIDHGVYNTET